MATTATGAAVSRGCVVRPSGVRPPGLATDNHTGSARPPATSPSPIAAGRALALGVAAPAANAAERTPVAQYLDQTVADTEAEIGGALDALGLEAAE